MPPLFWPLVALVTGILGSPFLDLRYVWISLPLACGLATIRPRVTLGAIAILGAVLAGRYDAIRPPSLTDDGLPHRVTARLAGPPEPRGGGIDLLCEIIMVDGDAIPHGRARLSWFPGAYTPIEAFGSLDLGRGDLIEVVVHLRSPTGYRTPGVFDYPEYFEQEGVFWFGTVRSLLLIEVRENGWHGPDRLRRWAGTRIARHFPDQTVGPLVLGMVLGQRRLLPAEVEQAFERAGLIHMLVVSGFNLAVVAATATGLGQCLRLGRYQRTGSRIFALLLVLVYAWLVGGGAPVLRATLMACVLIAGKILDRGYAVGNALAFTAIVMLVVDPTVLHDPAFQLSFGAVLAILIVASPVSSWSFERTRLALNALDNLRIDRQLEDRVTDLRVRIRLHAELQGWPLAWMGVPLRALWFLAEVAVVTTCIQICLLPFSIESLHRLTPVSIPLNILGAVVAALVTPLGLTLIILPEFAGAVPAQMTDILVRQLVTAVEWGLTVPGGTMRVPSAPVPVWLVFGAGVLLAAAGAHSRGPIRFSTGLLSVVLALAVMAIVDFSPSPPRDPKLTFLDVGQGDSTLVELPDGQRFLIDAGGVPSGTSDSGGGFRVGEEVVSQYLFSRRIRRIDTVVLTHAHHDHMDGIMDVVENFQVGEVWLGTNPMLPGYRALLEAIYAQRIPLRHVRTGDAAGPFEVLNPPPNRAAAAEVRNDDSVVLLLRWGEQTALLPGDLEGQLSGVPAMTDVLKIPHHGSPNTRLRTTAPVRVISVGAHNRFGHPGANRLPALRTDLLGTIEVTLAPGGPRIEFPGLR